MRIVDATRDAHNSRGGAINMPAEPTFFTGTSGTKITRLWRGGVKSIAFPFIEEGCRRPAGWFDHLNGYGPRRSPDQEKVLRPYLPRPHLPCKAQAQELEALLGKAFDGRRSGS